MTPREAIAALYLQVLDGSPMIAQRQIGLENAAAFIAALERVGFVIVPIGESVEKTVTAEKHEHNQ